MGGDQPQSTAEVIASMLTEPTGVALCDSGGVPKYDENGKYVGSSHGYGRAYERNHGMTVKDWDATPEATLDARRGELSVTVSLYHYLVNRLDYEPELDRLFLAWSSAREGTYYLQDMEEFPTMLARWSRYEDVVEDWATIAAEHWEGYEGPKDRPWAYDEGPDLERHEADLERRLRLAWRDNRLERDDEEPPGPVDVLDGLYGDQHAPIIVYSYNEECALSQDIQVALFSLDTVGTVCGPFVLLQVHGGCDARGGLTRPRLFSFNGRYDSCSILDWGRVTVAANIEGAPNWDSENGGYSYSADVEVGDKWRALHIDPDKTPVLRDVPASLAPAVARVVAAYWRGDGTSLVPTEMQPDLFGGEAPMVVGDYPPDVREALDYLNGIEDYNYGDFTLVTDDEGGAFCPVSGGKLMAFPS